LIKMIFCNTVNTKTNYSFVCSKFSVCYDSC
jgi:hypothetical protein